MPAKDHHLVGLFASWNFRDRVVNFHRLSAEAAFDVYFRFHGSGIQQSPQQCLVLSRNVGGRNSSWHVVPSADAHVQQAVLLFGSQQHRADAFLREEFRLRLPQFAVSIVVEGFKSIDLRPRYGDGLSPQGVSKGLPGATCSRGRFTTTIAPFSLPLYCCRSSGFSAVTPITGPRKFPIVPADQPAVSSVNICGVGETIRPVAGLRVQRFAIIHGSRCAFERPSALKRSI